MIGLFSIRVMKLACWGKISKFPCVFLEDTETASVSRINCCGEMIRTCKVGLAILTLNAFLYTLILASAKDPIYINLSAGMLSNLPDNIIVISFTVVSFGTLIPFLPVWVSVIKKGCVK
ncbi:MAG: hypothetical protein UT04_C0055G0003 [Candidatus Daviesbacteria bacterium GW2011_GWF2_38_7]|nr:MAG: hypothetical protein UT04_C0055G0003 [Candidatus Daviesbacteria bacterium GW2011_GWF2_38_7]